jgi:hypothetical protein
VTTRKQKWWIGAVFTAVVVLVAAGFAWFAGDDDGEPNTTAPAAAPTTAPATAPSNNGRSGFADPVTDLLGRKVMIPNNPAGEVLPQQDPAARIGCDPVRGVPSPESVMIQRNFDSPHLFSTSDGPTRIDGDLLRGYTRTPQGAALAGWNTWERLQVGGETARRVLADQVVMTDEQRTKVDEVPALGGPELRQSARQAAMAPEAFRVLSCDAEYVSVEYAVAKMGDENGPYLNRQWLGYRFTMLWRDGDWKLQPAGSTLAPAPYLTLGEGWTTWAV